MRMLKNMVKPDRPRMTIRHMRIAYWVPKATNTHSQYVILIAFSLQQWLHEQALMLRYTYIACVTYLSHCMSNRFPSNSVDGGQGYGLELTVIGLSLLWRCSAPGGG